MLSGLQSVWKATDLRNKVGFTLLMFLVFRLGAHIPVPGIDTRVIENLINSGAIFGFFDMFSGGAFRKFSIFAMSIIPYINASIIMQLLTVVIPSLEKMAKEGEEGRKKITQITRYGTVVLGFIQAIGMSFGLSHARALTHSGIASVLLISIALTAGTVFLMWIGEQITAKGIGNGISLIIFAGIVSRIPSGLYTLSEYWRTGAVGVFSLLLFFVIAMAVILLIIMVQQAQRRVPVQYAKRLVGRRMYGGQSTHIPLKVNQAGVIPVIFASSLLLFPVTIAQFVTTPWVKTVASWFNWGTALHTILYFALVVFFTYFYTAITFNINDVAENMKKYGGFIPGLRPGRPTAEYLDRIMTRITLVGAVFLGFIAILPSIIVWTTGIQGIYFGGTSLLIAVGVALDTMKQLEAHMLMRNYQGFMK